MKVIPDIISKPHLVIEWLHTMHQVQLYFFAQTASNTGK